MFFSGLFQRKLASLLRPWLSHEPELEVKLGFFTSVIVGKNFNLDVSSLNNLIEDNQELSLLFRSVTVDEVIVRVAHWRAPAFTVELNGVNVTLFLEKRAFRRVEESVGDYLEERKKKILAKIDNVGSMLHDNIEKMLMTTTSRSRLKDSITNLLLMHCFLRLHDVRIRMEYPVSDEKFSWLCYSQLLNAQSSHKELKCLLCGFIGLLFQPLRETSFNLEAAKLEIGSEKKDHSYCILSSINPYFDIRMKDLCLVNSALSVPEMYFSFSPTQLQMMGAFNNLLSIECKCVRSGRLLWGIARWKIRYSLLLPRYTLYNVTLVAVLWLRLVKEYHSLLILVGYSQHGVKISNGRNFPRLAEQQHKMISQIIEKELPAEAIASARQVARYRAALKEHHAEDIAVSPISSDPNSFWRIILSLAFIWQGTVKIFEFIATIFRLLKKSPKANQPRMGSEVADPRCCFHLSLGKILAVFSPVHVSRPPVLRISKLRKRTSHTDELSLILLMKEFLFIHEEGVFEQYNSFTLGFFEVTHAPVGLENETRPKNVGGVYKGRLKERLDGLETIVWGEPALMCCHSEDGETGLGNIPILEQLSEEMELIWKRMEMTFQGSKGNYDGKPWLVCVIQTFWVYPGLKSPESGFSKYDLLAGRLNFSLGHSAVVSIAALCEQVQYALCEDDGSEGAVVQLGPSRMFEESGETYWPGGLKTMKVSILKLLPDKHVEVRAVTAGPRVRISVGNEELSSSNLEPNADCGFNLTMEVHDIEFAIWPTTKSGVSPCEENERPDNFESEFFILEEPVVENLSGSVNLRYASKGKIALRYYLRLGGLKAYFEDMVDNHLMQVLLVKPMTAKFSSLRDYQYSFARSLIASSLCLRGAMSGVSGSFYMDELSVIYLVVESLYSAASTPAHGYSGLRAAQNHPLLSEDQSVQVGPVDQEMLIGGENEAALSSESALYFISASFELVPFDIILHDTRNGADRECFSMLFDAYNIQNLGLTKLPSTGISLSIQKICTSVSVGESKAEADANVHNFQATMFRYKNQAGDVDKSEVKNGALHSVDCMHEFSLSNFTFNLLLDCLNDSGEQSEASNETRNRNPKTLLSFPSIVDDKSLNSKQNQNDDPESKVSTLIPAYLLLINITADEIFMGSCSIKSGLSWSHPADKLYLSLSIRNFQSIVFGIQGGQIFIEATVLVGFSRWLTLYLQFIRNLLVKNYPYTRHRETAEGGLNVLGETRFEDSAKKKTPLASAIKQEFLEALSIDVSQLSLVLLVMDESKLVKEIIGRVNLDMKIWSENRKKKLLFNLSNLDILSMIQNEGMMQSEKNIRLPRFSSIGSSKDSSWLSYEDSSETVSQGEKTYVLSKDASYSSALASAQSSVANGSVSPVGQSSRRQRNCILEQLAISISAEKPFSENDNGPSCLTQGWVGNGSVSGLNLTISLSQIQMLFDIIGSFSEVSGIMPNDLVERSWMSHYHESEKDLEAALPDGAIVAIQDVHQHLYLTVESVENKYKLGGTVHYSLAGKRALFKVSWQRRRMWNFSASWFSLVSLYAKSDSGVPLRLNYSRLSDFVDISSNDDSTHALWKIAKREIYQDDVDLDPLNHLFKNSFYLVNKKNDCGAAFIHDALEFVKKPGNPFKFKIFHGLPVAPGLMTPETHLPETLGPRILDGQDISEEAGIAPCINLKIEKVSVIIVHELSDLKDKLPLLQASVDVAELKIQILLQKIRVINTLSALLYYFDAHRVIWREFVQPIEICVYWRSTSPLQATERPNLRMHSRLHFRMQELNLSLTEFLLDILLYVAGKLELVGPFAVKNAAVLGNCCKVANQLDLDLICHFHSYQSTRVGGRQSTFFLLRHLDPAASYATILLENPRISSTSSVQVPLSRTQLFAWRTRIISQQDSRTCPGPFIVFDISKTAEEGLSLDVSPLLRIHNNTGFPMELRIQRPESTKAEIASVVLRKGDTVDDCMAAFDAISLSSGPKKALLSLGVGNFVFAFRPEINKEDDSSESCSVEWSEDLKGEKAVCLSGFIDKLSYQVRKAFSSESWKYSFSTVACSMKSGDAQVAQMHFLVQSIARDVPIMQPKDHRKSKNSSISLQEQKEIFLLPTVRVFNLLESDIDVLLTETESSTIDGTKNINQARIQCGSTCDLYANPAVIYFNITLAMFGSSCKPVNCSQWLKKLNNKKDGIQFLDIDLEFCGGLYFASLRLARGNRGMLEAIVFTQYTLRNDTDFLLFCAAPHLKPLSREAAERHAITTPPQFGTLLPSKSTRSWFMKSSKLSMKLLDEESSKSILDLDALSGLAELNFTKLQGSGMKHLVKLGISLGPQTSKIDVPARMVSVVPRFIISNDSDEQIFVRQCLEDDYGETLRISSKQKEALFFRVGSRAKQDISVFNKLLQKHKVVDDGTSIFLQFSPNEAVWGWSGPVCVASLGCFFLKFKRHVESSDHQLDLVTREDDISWEFASVHVVEEGSTFVLHFRKPPNTSLPYRIENHLHDASISYYQKDVIQQETLASGGSVSYVWDDLTRPHKLMVKINGTRMPREISLDKLRPWKSFFRVRKERDLASHLPIPLYTGVSDRRTNIVQRNGIDVGNVGFEVCVDGPTRVLRISHSPGSRKADSKYQSSMKIQFRISFFALRLLEPSKQYHLEDVDPYDLSTYEPIVIWRLENISVDSIVIDQRKYNQIRVLSLDIDEKWIGAPFASLLRRHLTSNSFADDSILFAVFVLFPSTSSIRNVRYSSIILQPINLNLDEETLMKIVPYWRTSLSSTAQSQQYYFDHFEIHPVKITASFLPVDSYSNYSSGQEALRSLLHGVIKIPAIKNLEVELNGVLVSHALVTTRELLLRCARHYSWYGMRAIYIAKGSPLLPPTFASVFDDLASSSLDVFFDPSSSLFNVPGLTLGTFKLIRKCIEEKGFSGTKRYFGDLSKTLKNAGSNILFAAVTEVTDSVLKGAESSGFNGMVIGFHHGILRLAMEPSLLGTALLEGGPDRRVKLDRSPGIDEMYVEGYLQAMLDTIYKQDYLRVRVIDDQVILKNLPPNSSLIDEIMERVKDFLVSKALLKGDISTSSRPLRHLRGENEWRIGPTVLTLFEHLFVSFAIRMLRKQTNNAMGKFRLTEKWAHKHEASESSSSSGAISEETKGKSIWRRGIGKFALSAVVAYVDGRLCRCIPNAVVRRIVSGFLLSFLDNSNSK